MEKKRKSKTKSSAEKSANPEKKRVVMIDSSSEGES